MQGRKILFGVTGGIAAFKAAQWVRSLVREEALVTVVMTRAATRFVSELTFAALSGRPVHVEIFAKDPRQVLSHITLAAEAEALLIAPATAHTIARLAHGLADDLLTTTVLAATGKPVVVCPAMNSGMFTHPATQDNLRRLRELGYIVVEPDSGVLACGAEGPGRLPGWDGVREVLLSCFAPDDLRHQHVLVTAGPTREPLDPARYLSNRSSGKMGYALARTARRRGAQVSLVSGPVALDPPPGVELFRVNTAREMHEQVMRLRDRASIIIKAAAVSDFRPARSESRKIKKSGGPQTIDLVANVDILAELGRNRRPGQILVGFAAESHDHQSEGARKLRDKNLDLIVVNDICSRETGFAADTNQVTLMDKSGRVATLPLLSKEETAERIWDQVVSLLSEP